MNTLDRRKFVNLSGVAGITALGAEAALPGAPIAALVARHTLSVDQANFRTVRGHRDDVVIEIFPDEGPVRMAKALRAYREAGYDGMLVPDHISMSPEGPGPVNFAFCHGYIRGLLQSGEDA